MGSNSLTSYVDGIGIGILFSWPPPWLVNLVAKQRDVRESLVKIMGMVCKDDSARAKGVASNREIREMGCRM